MTTEIKKDRYWKVARDIAILGGGGAAAVVIIMHSLAPDLRPVPRIEWEHAGGSNIVFEVWHSTDLRNWRHLTNTAETFLPVKYDKPQEFFKVRVRDTNTGLVSDWATTPAR